MLTQLRLGVALAGSLLAFAAVAPAQQPDPDRAPAEAPAEDEDVSAQRLPPLGEAPDRPFFETRPEVDWPLVRKFLESHFPDWADELRRLERTNPRLFRMRMRDIGPRAMRLMQQLEDDEELGSLAIEEERLELAIRRTARQYVRAAGEPQRNRLMNELRELVGQRFDLQHRRGQRMISKLETRLERMRQRLERRVQDRQQVIAEEVDAILLAPESADPEERLGPPGRQRGPRRE